jgi:PAS domain S-box-containing protein
MSFSQMPDLSPEALEHPHVVQFYADDAHLIDEVSRVLGRAIVEEQCVLVIATADHREKIARSLREQIRDFDEVIVKRRYVEYDAAELLSKFMVGGTPDPQRFRNALSPVILRAAKVAKEAPCKVVAFGEMVAVLCAQGHAEAAIELEGLWNQLAREYPFFLYCAYPMQAFRNFSEPELFLRIYCAHTGVVGGERLSSSEPKKIEAASEHLVSSSDMSSTWQEIEHRFRLFVEAVRDYAIFMLDPRGNITTWNDGAKNIKGYDSAEIIGRHFSAFYTEEDVRSRKPEMNLEIAAREGRFEDEGWRVRKDGSKFWASVVITAIRDELGHLVGFGKVTRDFTEKMQAQRALDRANQELRREILERRIAEQRLADSERSLRSLSAHLLRTQDEERKRIGRDLHDSLGQLLTAMKIGLASVKSDTQTEEAVSKCSRLADDCIREVRTISYLLYPPMLEELGLKSAIPWYLDGFAERSGIKTSFECAAEFDRLPREMELGLFRVLQEALTNVHRHSESLVANVRLRMESSSAVLEIEDAGKGIPAEVLGEAGELPRTGVGLRGMNERMRQLGGRLEVSSNGQGATLSAVVPVQVSRREGAPVSAAA